MTTPPTSGSLAGLVAFVNGAARLKSIGHATAIALAKAGADLVVSDLSATGAAHMGEIKDIDAQEGWKGLPSLVEELEGMGRKAFAVTGNVTSSAEVARMVEASVAHFGKIDILFNNAAAPVGPDRGEFWDIAPEVFDRVMAINVLGTFLMCKAVLPRMTTRGWGRVINNSSHAGKIGQPRLAAYTASKFAMLGLSQSLSLDVAPMGITVNAVCPSHIETSRWDAGLGVGGLTAEEVAAKKARLVAADNPVGRSGTPEDVANVVTFLSQRESSYITGQAINVAGGWIMQ